MIQDIKNKVRQMVGAEYLYLDTPLKIKTSPHTMPLMYWGVCVSPDERLYIMDADQEWSEVEEKDSLIVGTLHQRISIIHHQTATAWQTL